MAGLCPRCLAFGGSSRDANREPSAHAEAPTLDRPHPGRIVAGRYQTRDLLGRGGMGEVWRAFDLKLRVDVALKSIRAERLSSATARERLLQEVRSAREVTSPNVCRVFDLVEDEGSDLVSMEYVDGTTLAETLRERGPFSLQEAREIASQLLSGLEAIHRAGLIHRDLKPENVMLTRAGRVVVMDFGLAKGPGDPRATVSGTPAYMAPEQARGEALDPRADVFATGVILAEMLAVGGETAFPARQALWKAVRETPPVVPEGPWAEVLRRALDPDPAARPESAQALSRALEEVTLRLPGFEGKRPYPGLASFTEAEAEYFFGREAEVEAVWRKLKRPRLLALIGPSGTGKSSFVRAGLLPALPSSWAAVVATPGNRPFRSLARALVPSFASDASAVQELAEALLRFEELDTALDLLSRWRKRHEHVLVVVDQFEELFTLNPPETQAAFAELLGRLVLEADAHVLLSLRDDFLFQCHAHEALAPAFADLTPLGTLSDSALRRALVQPALACGYRFEDESLVDEMVGEVSQERGALPLLAFAASRLWEKRDRERGLLTRDAYQESGGVAGALAQHAEATLERIGTQKAPVVRELFRNLVTAQGTRAVRQRDELLSVFGDRVGVPQASPGIATRAEAEAVLGALVDARLLTSFERAGDGVGDCHQEIEIVHESLLSRWPRLVRWQTQDADGAQLRDQLRQAAQLWHDRGQPEDLLWSGTAHRDFALWRERYPVRLTAIEQDFAHAVDARAKRRRRLRRAVAAGTIAAAATVALVTSALWRQAQDQARRAEAGKWIAIGQRYLATYPTASVAYALKSLELADSQEGRLLAVRARQEAPVARIIPALQRDRLQVLHVAFSPDARWLALGGMGLGQLLSREGSEPRLFEADAPLDVNSTRGLQLGFTPDGEVLVGAVDGAIRAWSVPDLVELWRAAAERGRSQLWVDDSNVVTATVVGDEQIVRSWTLGSRDSRIVARLPSTRRLDVAKGTLAMADGRRLYLDSSDQWGAAFRFVAELAAHITGVKLSVDPRQVAAVDAAGELSLWPVGTRDAGPLGMRRIGPSTELAFDREARRLIRYDPDAAGDVDASVVDMAAPPDTVGLRLPLQGRFWLHAAFDPSGSWIAGAHMQSGSIWPSTGPHPYVLMGHASPVTSIDFVGDGRRLLSSSSDGTVRVWSLFGQKARSRILVQDLGVSPTAVADASGRFVVANGAARLTVVPLAGGPLRELTGTPADPLGGFLAISPDGQLVARSFQGEPAAEQVRVWNLETGAMRTLGRVPGTDQAELIVFQQLLFVDRNRLLATVGIPGARNSPGTLLYDLRDGSVRQVSPASGGLGYSTEANFGIGVHPEVFTAETPTAQIVRFTLDGGPAVPLPSHGSRYMSVALDRRGKLVASATLDGTIRIGLASGEEPHIRHGPEGWAGLAFSPDSRWLASGHRDGSIRLWPVPDVTRTPMHLRSYEELLAVLRSDTNLRVVDDPSTADGHRLEVGPFPGWSTVPEW